MKLHRNIVMAALLATAAVTVTGTAHAQPQPSPSTVTYRADIVDGDVLTTLDGGTFALASDRDVVEIRDTAGTVLDALPLGFRVDGQQLGIEEQISADGTTLRLRPQLDTIDHAALKPVASPVENQLAMNDLINSVSIGTSIGSLIGTAVGAVLGIGVGIAMAGVSCLVLTLGCIVTILPTIGLTGAIGALAGSVLVGGPTAAVALYEYITTLNTAPGQSKFAPHVPVAPTPAER
ncbi:ammonium transporter [Nocardia fluminea]|uniref:ammonium transporter n=1 Tax=Nocardia fluminea TaxID=134984 RepID=UPI00343FD3BC